MQTANLFTDIDVRNHTDYIVDVETSAIATKLTIITRCTRTVVFSPKLSNDRTMMTSNANRDNNQTIMNIKEKEKYIESFVFPNCDDTSKYEKVAKIGQGTFG